MQIAMSESNEKGGLTSLLFHCFFNEDGSITHFSHEFDSELYRSLPNLYAICISQNSMGKKKITAGFVIKTSYTDHDADFVETLTNVAMTDEKLSSHTNNQSSFLPARIRISGETLLTEDEMLQVMMTQAIKHGVGGTA